MVTGTVEEAIEHARRSLYPLLAYSAGGDANSDFICTVPLTSSAHAQVSILVALQALQYPVELFCFVEYA